MIKVICPRCKKKVMKDERFGLSDHYPRFGNKLCPESSTEKEKETK